MFRIPILYFALMSCFSLIAQDNYQIRKITTPIIIDGILDEEGWKNNQVTNNFTQYFPNDNVEAVSGSEIMFAYDEDNIYFAAKMYNLTNDRKYVVPSLRRDYRGNIDGVSLIIDPFQDNTNAFQFGINAYGVQREGLIANGGQRPDNLSHSWDNKWVANAKQYEGYWIAEAAIPFKTLRYKEGTEKWNINVYRIDTETGERSTWTPIPRIILIISLAFMKELQFDQPLDKPGANISIIPYVAGNVSKDFDNPNEKDTEFGQAAGFDAKIAVTPSLNLDLTVNPDFSQVEVDEQVTNLDRFELFFPEKRQFFLENEDLFSSSGHPFLARPFFSRRIGIARDTSTGVNVQNKIHYGARLSGKLDNNWRIGLLNMQEAKIENIQKPTTNYTVGVLQRKIFSRSNLTATFVNKEPINGSLNGDSSEAQSYNRVVGLDYNIQSSDAKWSGKVFYHQSFDNNNRNGQFAHAAWLMYNSNTWIFSWAHVLIGNNYDAEVGYVPRQGILRFNPEIGYGFFTNGGFFNKHIIILEYEPFWNSERMTDQKIALNYESALTNTGSIMASVVQRYTYLLDDFDPTNTDGELIAAGTDYTYMGFEFMYRSDLRKSLGYSFGGYTGKYFNGQRHSITTEVSYRFQPFSAINMSVNYNKLLMPDPYKDADLLLIGPRIDVTFTKSIFLTTFIQYNNQIENVNINTRFQWRFKPVSDLFIVYTDNYGTEQMQDYLFQKKNRALILKLTYWFNL